MKTTQQADRLAAAVTAAGELFALGVCGSHFRHPSVSTLHATIDVTLTLEQARIMILALKDGVKHER